jgi:hypothetical protein
VPGREGDPQSDQMITTGLHGQPSGTVR